VALQRLNSSPDSAANETGKVNGSRFLCYRV
jgi:hypothetical protein